MLAKSVDLILLKQVWLVSEKENIFWLKEYMYGWIM